MSKPASSFPGLVWAIFLISIGVAVGVVIHHTVIHKNVVDLRESVISEFEVVRELISTIDLSVSCDVDPSPVSSAFSGDDFSWVTMDQARGLHSTYMADGGGLKAVNIYSELICGLHEDLTSRTVDVPAYRIYYGNTPGSDDEMYGIIVPLSLDPATTNYRANFSSSVNYMSVKIPSNTSAIGPCPMNCYGEGGSPPFTE